MKKKISLRSQLIILLVGFIVLVLGLIYFFQTALLDDFYKINKIKSIENIAHEISNNLSNEDLEDILNKQTYSNEVCVRIVSDSINVIGYTENSACVLGRLNEYQIKRMTSEVEQSDNQKLFGNIMFEGIPGNERDIYIYGELSDIQNEQTLVLVAASIIPLGATEQTIADQFKLIALIVVVATIILALIISRIILKPIKQIESQSSNLPRGEYDYKSINTTSKELDSLNNTLATANEEINKADSVKRELIANVSHDLRTPLTMIVGYGEMIRDLPEEDSASNAEVIINEAKRLSRLVDDLLDVSKLQGGKIELDLKEISLNALLKDVFNQYKLYCKSKKIKFKLEVKEDTKVKVDEVRIKQVLYNFINNAINYNDKQKKEITIGVEKINSTYRVYVYDNGEGIEESDINNVWDRYYKVDKEHKRAQVGSGIGLSVAKELLVAHKFNYGIESEKGEYSKFYFDIK